MAFYKNLTTGLVWDVEGDLEKRLSEDSGYELVVEENEEKKEVKTSTRRSKK